MNNTPSSAGVAAALHRVFACSPHSADSLELWLAIAAEATRHLTAPAQPAAPAQWLPVFVSYRRVRTDAEYDPGTAAVRITTGPLRGITYTDPDSAARAVVTASPLPPPDEDGDDVVEVVSLVPTWRLPGTDDPAAQIPTAVSG
ncbi:hypothetical protein NONI108955_44710 [Nocardia ninae]|uniref:Uncharacterized protein n=1 Tax=Nocardia ninae NBRC 108245 TaxID=1210091 RepID=A0A511MUH6_9NOCA|nr:hypothetical protein [Nocardia ninae]GEM44239.1 hypothetical protein NN4_87580 [Nocardia ninae NBRC 108245]